eukprot:TRINITY_DN77242_c0_g1_i1.p1 TRINITY_DN77242_c0_g1~~TRINITY_DN77242_c0_g1_i1.p1  ORF type:complete len:156 (-),score=19.66 TRINITY_DN77242_c0_g1_i1:265-693(-)
MLHVTGGFLVWLMPFAVSCLFIGPDGKMSIDEGLFRSIMIFVGSLTAAWCTGRCNPQTRWEGLELAVVWLTVNWTLDLIVLVPLMASTAGPLTLEAYLRQIPLWFTKTGMAYVGFVSMCYVGGASAERALKSRDSELKPHWN